MGKSVPPSAAAQDHRTPAEVNSDTVKWNVPKALRFARRFRARPHGALRNLRHDALFDAIRSIAAAAGNGRARFVGFGSFIETRAPRYFLVF